MPASNLPVFDFLTRQAASGNPKLVGSRGSMVAKLKLKGIFGDARVESGPNFQFSKLSTHSKQQRQTSDIVHSTKLVILPKPNELER